MTVQVHQTEIVDIEKTTFAEEGFSAAGPAEDDADSSPHHDDAATCCWYPSCVGRVGWLEIEADISGHTRLDHIRLDHTRLDHTRLDHTRLDHNRLDHTRLDHTRLDHTHTAHHRLSLADVNPLVHPLPVVSAGAILPISFV